MVFGGLMALLGLANVVLWRDALAMKRRRDEARRQYAELREKLAERRAA